MQAVETDVVGTFFEEVLQTLFQLNVWARKGFRAWEYEETEWGPEGSAVVTT
jgi:hypothetical protein